MKVDWYFDFISPFAYLQLHQLSDLGSDVELSCRPVLFTGLLNHWGQLGPAEIPPKRLFTYKMALWLAHERGVPMRVPQGHPFNPLPFLRLSIAADNSLAAIRRIFHYIWAEQGELAAGQAYNALATELGIDDPATINSQRIKDALRQTTDAAIAKGVFGVPSLVIDRQVIWGQDATAMLRTAIDNPEFFDKIESEAAALQPLAARSHSRQP